MPRITVIRQAVGERYRAAFCGPTRAHTVNCITEHLEAALLGADAPTCDDIARSCWRALEHGEISEADAESISLAVEAQRQRLREISRAAAPKPVLSKPRRPRSPDRAKSLERRRRQAASGAMPPQIAAGFTMAEQSALAVVARECRQHGRCALFIDQVAAMAGTCRTVVKNAIRQAAYLGLLAVKQRRRRGRKSDTNVLRIADAGWLAWLKLGPPRVTSPTASITRVNYNKASASQRLQVARRYDQEAKLAPHYVNTA
jgi:hypothetical protein